MSQHPVKVLPFYILITSTISSFFSSPHSLYPIFSSAILGLHSVASSSHFCPPFFTFKLMAFPLFSFLLFHFLEIMSSSWSWGSYFYETDGSNLGTIELERGTRVFSSYSFLLQTTSSYESAYIQEIATPLWYASNRGHLHVVNWLLNLRGGGVYVDVTNKVSSIPFCAVTRSLLTQPIMLLLLPLGEFHTAGCYLVFFVRWWCFYDWSPPRYCPCSNQERCRCNTGKQCLFRILSFASGWSLILDPSNSRGDGLLFIFRSLPISSDSWLNTEQISTRWITFVAS